MVCKYCTHCQTTLLFVGLQSDIYMWGRNSNYTLGQGDANNRDHPELVEALWNDEISVKQVCVLICDAFYVIFAKEGCFLECFLPIYTIISCNIRPIATRYG